MATESDGTSSLPGGDRLPPAEAPDGGGVPAPRPGAADAATRGLDAVLGREVAMVTLPPARGEDLVVRTEQVRRLAGLHHAHLVEVFDVDGLAEDTESTLVLQSVDGRALDPGTDRSSWAPLAVAEIGAQLASGLAHAHARGVVHGQIGLASVVVGGSPGAPYAWLTGFTAALHPAPPVDAAASTGPAVLPPHPADDVADLGRALALVLDPQAPAAPALDQELADMGAGRVAARTAAESLAHIAEALRHVDEDETGIVPVVLPDPAPPAPSDDGAAEAVVTSTAVGAAAATPTGTGLPMGATAAAASPSVPAPRVPDAGDVAGDTDRRARRIRLAGRGVQFAALGGATLALAAASGFVLWAAEGTGTPRQIGTSGLTSPTEAGGPAAAMVPPGGPPPGPPPGDLTPPEFTEHGEDAPVRQTRTRSPITDVTTLPRRAPVRPPVSPAPPVTTVPTSPTTGTSTSTPTSSTTAPTSSSGSTSTVPPSSRAPGAATLAAP